MKMKKTAAIAALVLATIISGCSLSQESVVMSSANTEPTTQSQTDTETEKMSEEAFAPISTYELSAVSTEETAVTEAEEPLVYETENAEVFSFLSEEFDVGAKNALLYDVDGDKLLYGKNVKAQAFPASITKLVTIMTALEYVTPDTAFTVGTEVYMPMEGSSLAFLLEGQQLSMRQLIYALLLPSGNDAAYVVAVNTARAAAEDTTLTDEEANEYFAGLMNKFAEKIGANNSHFSCCDGFHRDNHYTTAEDLLTFVKKAIEYDVITDVCCLPEAAITFLSGEYATWYNSNALLYPENEHYLPYVTGMKTGFTDEAGYCFVGTAEKDGHRLIVVTLGCESVDSRWGDVTALLGAGYDYLGAVE